MQGSRFREDLFYRLSVVNIKLPPLRERGEDIVLIANAFLRRACEEHRRTLRFSVAALQAMGDYAWPGNIRELENAVQRAVIMARGRFIEASDLGIEVKGGVDTAPSLREARGRAEREALVEALMRTRGNISQAAKHLGISRPTFHGLLVKFGVNARDFR
jgi:two-component system NtrC family response regulator